MPLSFIFSLAIKFYLCLGLSFVVVLYVFLEWSRIEDKRREENEIG